MTLQTVTKEQEISLDGVRYKVKDQVQSGLISNDALKIVTADHNRDYDVV